MLHARAMENRSCPPGSTSTRWMHWPTTWRATYTTEGKGGNCKPSPGVAMPSPPGSLALPQQPSSTRVHPKPMHTPQVYSPGRLHGTPAMLVIPCLPTDIYTEKPCPATYMYVLTQTSSMNQSTTRQNTDSKTCQGIRHVVTTYPVNCHVQKNYFMNHPPCMDLFLLFGYFLLWYVEPYSAQITKTYFYYYFLAFLFVSRFWHL